MSKIEVNQISSQCGSTLTIGQSGDSIQLACGATQTGFGRTGTVDWDTTAKTASFTAVSGNGYFVNTTSGAITVTLPAGSAGSIVSLKDYANTWNTNNVTVTPNGTDKINGTNDNASLTTQDQSVTLVYVDSTKGWRAVQDSTSDVTGASFITATGGTIVTCGDYKTHIFTGPGTFTVCSVGNPAGSDAVDYLVVAGGGGGGAGHRGGGGGAGGFRLYSSAPGCNSPLNNCSALPVTVTGYPITVGAGGANTGCGANSVFSTITSAGGGFGNDYNCGAVGPGNPGGSGGGGNGASTGGSGGTGNTPPVSPPQGNPGGQGGNDSGPARAGGGGGGAGVAGSAVTPTPSGDGGPGGDGSYISDNFIGPTAPSYGTPGPVGSTRYFAGGGGGGSYTSPFPASAGSGGAGGGADGAGYCGGYLPVPANATVNTGGGGGGASAPPGGVTNNSGGGSGIVMIRYKYQ